MLLMMMMMVVMTDFYPVTYISLIRLFTSFVNDNLFHNHSIQRRFFFFKFKDVY